ncbi:AraC family transcriptional regulator [Niallia sp.]|uniref:AraC family transcriptional regulator n=1 Tax=Niallia sp. TaxID=2837523 RepID=UPI0028A03208|nr:AraC family transcriptional regulator [Niallia sp.]
MPNPIYSQYEELTDFIRGYSNINGTHQTAIPSLFFSRQTSEIGPSYGVHKTSLCIVVQGLKEVYLAQDQYIYGPSDYLITSHNVPVTGQVLKASNNDPYLSLKLEFTPNQILEVLNDAGIRTVARNNTKRAMYINKIESALLDAVLRLVRLLENPNDIPVLAPLVTKEILYRVLQGRNGMALEQIAIEASSTNRIHNVIDQIIKNYDRPFRVEELADIANMSVSSLHRHFKEVTAMSPIQYQKQLRLQEARRLLLSETTDASDVAFQVGYESPSQFSREYSRMFGFPPIEDIKRLRAEVEQPIKS